MVAVKMQRVVGGGCTTIDTTRYEIRRECGEENVRREGMRAVLVLSLLGSVDNDQNSGGARDAYR